MSKKLMRQILTRSLTVCITAFINIPIVFAQPDTLWTKTYTGGGDDFGTYVQQTSDGGYIIAYNTR